MDRLLWRCKTPSWTFPFLFLRRLFRQHPLKQIWAASPWNLSCVCVTQVASDARPVSWAFTLCPEVQLAFCPWMTWLAKSFGLLPPSSCFLQDLQWGFVDVGWPLKFLPFLQRKGIIFFFSNLLGGERKPRAPFALAETGRQSLVFCFLLNLVLSLKMWLTSFWVSLGYEPCYYQAL